MKFIIPPMTPEDAVTTVLNCCMHTMNNKAPWDDARQLLQQLMQDAFEMGYKKCVEERNATAAEVAESFKKTNEANTILSVESGANVDKLS